METTGYEALYLLTCFRTREAAQAFIDECGGRHFDPVNDREKRRRSVWTYRDWGDPADRYPEIVARLEVARSWEPALDADIAMLLGLPRPVRFTVSKPRSRRSCAASSRAGNGRHGIIPRSTPGFAMTLIAPGAMLARIACWLGTTRPQR